MSAPSSEAELKNLALLAIGSKPLTNFENTDDTTAITVNLLYDQCRRELLRSGLFNFARKRATLLLDPTAAPAFDYQGAYLQPDDCLKVHHVGTEYDQWYPYYHDIEGRYIYYGQTYYSNATANSIKIEYTKDVSDPTQMDALFIKVLRHYLAYQLCMPLTGNLEAHVLLERNYMKAYAEAQAVCHLERPSRVINRDPIAEARDDIEASSFDVQVPDSAWS